MLCHPDLLRGSPRCRRTTGCEHGEGQKVEQVLSVHQMSGNLISFCLIYNVITVAAIYRSENVAHGAEAMIMLLLVFWCVAALFLYLMYRFEPFSFNTPNKILLFLSTPIPSILVLLFSLARLWLI